MKSYQSIPIAECLEPLVAIPEASFSFTRPHPYDAFGAPYGGASPWMLRSGVLDALLQAQAKLAVSKPGWQLKLFDAYRPVLVQAYMVWREFQNQAELAGHSLGDCRDPPSLETQDPHLYKRLAAKVFEFWSLPSDDPHTPPPHSTGAAVDLTLQDENGQEIDMGSPIDETTERSYPDHYADTPSAPARGFHAHRAFLNEVMTSAGFTRHGNEWWHFSLGDQMWAWKQGKPAAFYGRADIIEKART